MELEFIKKIDELGRVVLPLEMRKALGLDTASQVRVECESDRIILIPVKP